ncbi:glycoside hydrolase [Choiromyces venosus 120613-1]|uniref:glucan endo-1,3-beta-D-glucosidase n=1 Tax=Choiromyces venosus 120613-1 TaxID=1336337 RepID=A0A3N4JNQ5_9PEZI|nr:glycoside hydrolase [Choiromyces venosus 120613-1]
MNGTRDGLIGLAADTIDLRKRGFGPKNGPGGAVEFYSNSFNPTIILGSTELRKGVSDMRVFDPAGQSARLRIYADENRYNRGIPDGMSTTKVIDIPICNGMGFVTAEYRDLTPTVSSIIAFEDIRQLSSENELITKYLLRFVGDADSWLLYAHHSSIKQAESTPFRLQIVGTTRLQGQYPFTGFLQVAHLSADNRGHARREALFDYTTGSYCTGVEIGAKINGPYADSGEYQMRFKRAGPGKSPLLMYALPHHVKTFHSSTSANIHRVFEFPSPSKGMMYGVIADTWRLRVESLPVEIGWLPLGEKGCASFPPKVLQQIYTVARTEIAQDLTVQTHFNPSMYFSGKAYAKYAFLCYSTLHVLKDPSLAQICLARLKNNFALFAENRQQNIMVYDATWGGVASIQAFEGGVPDRDEDFGNYLYSDHHFHYSYHVEAAALIVQLDKDLGNSNTWFQKHGEWVNTLLRDYANPSKEDPYFPVFRNFDWYHGHSWARGLISCGDSKDEESSSEDVNSVYAQKLWGVATDDQSMIARANLMLGILKVSLNEYMLMSKGNQNHPKEFVGNLVTGILSESKADHKTYFGQYKEYIQGIHMIPVTAMSPYIRSAEFCEHEYKTYFSKGLHFGKSGADKLWAGIIEATRAIFDAPGSWEFFSNPDFDDAMIDGGTSRTWFMILSAGMGGLNLNETCHLL